MSCFALLIQSVHNPTTNLSKTEQFKTNSSTIKSLQIDQMDHLLIRRQLTLNIATMGS